MGRKKTDVYLANVLIRQSTDLVIKFYLALLNAQYGFLYLYSEEISVS